MFRELMKFAARESSIYRTNGCDCDNFALSEKLAPGIIYEQNLHNIGKEHEISRPFIKKIY